MRFDNQQFVAGKKLQVRDAAGNNPVLLKTFLGNAGTGIEGRRILITTTAFASANGITADSTLDQVIPESYLTAGRLTFEDEGGIIYWSLSWGNYAGSNMGSTTNDSDGNFGPPALATSGLPFSTTKAVNFPGPHSVLSTTNLADYALTSGPSTWTRNNTTAVALPSSCVFADGFATGNFIAWNDEEGEARCDGAVSEHYDALHIGEACELPDGSIGTLVCAPSGTSALCR